MDETPNNKQNFLISPTILKFVYGKKDAPKKPTDKKVINNAVANNFLQTEGREMPKKNKTVTKIANNSNDLDNLSSKTKTEKGKYWFDSEWKGGIRIIGKTAYNYRSSWEANYARYLEMLRLKGVILKWEHEPEIFNFPKVKRGLKNYIPDFKITFIGGRIEYHEVKGFMDSKAKTKLKRFTDNYPHLTIKVIDKKWFDEVKSSKIKIDGWEI